MMSKTILVVAVAAAALLAAPFAAYSDAGHGHKSESADKADKADHHGSSSGHDATDTEVRGPAHAWGKLMAARNAIAEDIDRGELGDIHEKSEPLPKLAADLLEHSGDLDSGKRARVKGAIKQVTRVADSLHTAADSEDAARTRKELSRLDGLLELIRVQYPAGALEAPSHKIKDHGDHSASPHDGQAAHAHMEQPEGVVDAVPQTVVHVKAFDQLRFEPKRIEVQVGVPTRIELENLGAIEHSLVVKTPDGEQDWVHIHVSPGVTDAATYRLDAPGTYPLLCTIPGHTEGGMIGELVVLAAHETKHLDH